MSFLVGEPVVLSNTFVVATVPTDPTTASLIVTDPAGTAVTYTWAAATLTRTGMGAFTKTITASLAGTWNYAWVATGAVSDIAAGFFTVSDVVATYVTVPEIRALTNMTDPGKFTDSAIAGAIDWFETTFEDYTGVSWVERTATDERHYLTSAGLILLDHALPRTVSAVRTYSTAAASTAFTADELADLRVDRTGALSRVSLGRFSSSYGMVAVDYTHGHPSPPPDVVRAAKIAIQGELLKDKNGRLPYSINDGGVLQTFTRPGPNRPFGNEDVDEVANRRNQTVPAVA